MLTHVMVSLRPVFAHTHCCDQSHSLSSGAHHQAPYPQRSAQLITPPATATASNQHSAPRIHKASPDFQMLALSQDTHLDALLGRDTAQVERVRAYVYLPHNIILRSA
jgi:hypothetical protein